MKLLTFILFSFVFLQFVYSQEEIEDKQMMIGIDNVGQSAEVDHTVNPIGTYWEYDTEDWIVSSDPDGETSTITTVGESNFNNLGSWDGWNFFWLGTQSPNEDWALGFYKVSNDDNSEYFYIDCRVDKFGDVDPPYSNPDFWVYLDASTDVYKYDDNPTPTWNPISNGDIVRIWDVHDVDPPSSNSLEDFWENALVLVNDGNDHPRLVWGPYPDEYFSVQYYRVYKKKGSSNFQIIDTTTELDWIDTEETIITGGQQANEGICYYKITAVGRFQDESIETGYTNTVDTRVEGDPQQKIGYTSSNSPLEKFSLRQNYPNPFNPITMIHFSIKNKSFATLKIYDILGKEVAVLISDIIEAGNHSIEFSAVDLPSGIYMYQLQAGEKSLTKKMILLR
jgi:hypothetical protein